MFTYYMVAGMPGKRMFVSHGIGKAGIARLVYLILEIWVSASSFLGMDVLAKYEALRDGTHPYSSHLSDDCLGDE